MHVNNSLAKSQNKLIFDKLKIESLILKFKQTKMQKIQIKK